MLNLFSSGSRGQAGHRRRRGAWLGVVAVAAALALGVPTASTAAVRAAGPQATAARAAAAQPTAAQTTEQYVIRFWPRWTTYTQQLLFGRVAGAVALVGPNKISPLYNFIVAINNDTVYAGGFENLTNGPAVLTIPATSVTYSLLVLDMFGERVPVNIKPQTPGTYALVLKGWRGTLPRGVKKVTVPYRYTFWALRADKYSATGQNMIAQANAFRAALHLTTLAQYNADPASGPAKVVPVATFIFSPKVAQDASVTLTPTAFLRYMQRAVADPGTQPMHPSDTQLSQAFNADFTAAQQAARRGNPVPLARIDAAARRAYRAIVAAWKGNTSSTNWIHQDNFAEWGTDYLGRAAGSEYIQLGNNNAAAGYWDAFTDGTGRPLNGALHRYTLTFPASQLPDAKRFWSLTAYTPVNVEPIPNRLDKYLVARYTPGLVYNPDGSLTIYMAPTKPAGVPTANWLPVRRGLFSVLLRVYGPTGNTAPDATPPYTPPAITTMR